MACGYESSAVSLDANEIAALVFSEDEIGEEYKKSVDDLFLSLDLKTYFELLVIITTEGMKKNYGGNDNIVDVTNLTETNIQFINGYLKKIKVKLVVDVISRIDWNFDVSKQKKSYKEVAINMTTKLNDLNFILDKGAYIVISFEKL